MKRSQSSSSKKQQEMIAQIIQAYAQLTQEDPRVIMQHLHQLPADQQQKSLEGMYKAIQLTQQQGNPQMAQQQQMAPQEQQMSPEQAQMMQQQQMAGGMDQSQMGDQSQMAMYGGGMYKGGGSTYSKGVWFDQGGYVPEDLGSMAYGGYHSEIPRIFNQEVDRPNKAMYGMGMAQGGQPCYNCGGMYQEGGTPSMNNGSLMYDNQFEHGGIVVGKVMDASPELLQRLEEGGYTYKIVH